MKIQLSHEVHVAAWHFNVYTYYYIIRGLDGRGHFLEYMNLLEKKNSLQRDRKTFEF